MTKYKGGGVVDGSNALISSIQWVMRVKATGTLSYKTLLLSFNPLRPLPLLQEI